MKNYLDSIRRNVTRETESFEKNGKTYTVHRFYEDGKFLRADFYVDGWRDGVYTTEAGLKRRLKKLEG